MIGNKEQKEWLSIAKRNLSQDDNELTWDEFADLAGVKPNTFKTYRMPEDSINFRKMPDWIRENIERLLAKSGSEDIGNTAINTDLQRQLLVPALAALVVRQAMIAVINGRMIAGTDQQPNIPVGLSPEDRRAMSMVSAACLQNKLPDHGSEIHQLLFMCTKPFGDWLDIKQITDQGMQNTNLIDPDDGIPTAEADQLASGFSNITAQLDNQLFRTFKEQLTSFPEKSAGKFYTKVRESIVRYPLIHIDEFHKTYSDLPAIITVTIQNVFYEPVPQGWEIDGGVPICAHCGNALKHATAGLICRTNACRTSLHASTKASIPAAKLLRVKRGIKQYWVEPGFDEIFLYDKLINAGIHAELYPKQDLVDIAVSDIGIDLKAYTSPETLANKFNTKIGGLAHYRRKWVVIPDAIVTRIPAYMERLKNRLTNESIVCLTVSQAYDAIKKEFAGTAS